MNNQRALLVTVDFPPDARAGIARYYYDLCRGAGSVAVVTTSTDQTEFDGIQKFDIFRKNVPTSSRKFMRLVQALALVWFAVRTAQRRGYSVLIFGHWYLALTAPVVRAFTNLKCAAILHGGELVPYQRSPMAVRLILSCLRSSELIICNSNYTKSDYRSLDAAAPPAVVINPPVDYARFERRNGEMVRARHGLAGKHVLLTVGNLVPRKCHEIVITALPTLIGRGFDVRYLIVGGGSEEARLRELAATLGVANHVIFAGRISEEDLPDYYDACDVFVMLSRSSGQGRQAVEGFGIVYLEANCCGKPVVGVGSGGVAEAIADGESGLLVQPEDTLNQAVDAISYLLNDKKRARQLGEAGQARARNQFSLQVKGLQLTDCIDRLTNGGR